MAVQRVTVKGVSRAGWRRLSTSGPGPLVGRSITPPDSRIRGRLA